MTSLKNALDGFQPETALVLGSGLGALVDAVVPVHTISYSELDGFPVSGVTGHAGTLTAGTLGGHKVAVLSGRAHYYEHGDPAAMRPPLEALKEAGINRLILTNSAGSTNKKMAPGSVMQIKDHINFSGTNPLFGEPTDDRFVGLTSAYDKPMCIAFRHAAKRLDIKLHKGTYMWFSGPSFETPAEIKMARKMGADAVGMSTVPEVILARFLGMDVAALSVITNFAAGMTGGELSHAETKEMAPLGGEKVVRLITAVLEEGFA
ncbi:MAG: purine-nucleoside phosphorylase [Rhizobiaceae bacterium]